MTNPSAKSRKRSPKYAAICKRQALKKARTRDQWEERKCSKPSH